jgi:hypothetical protein
MRKITSMTFALGALLVAAVAARADDLQIATSLRQVGAPSLSQLNNAVYGIKHPKQTIRSRQRKLPKDLQLRGRAEPRLGMLVTGRREGLRRRKVS